MTGKSSRDQASAKAAAFDLSPEPALIVGPDGGLAATNEAAEALFGQALGQLARGRFAAALPPGSALATLLARAAEEGVRVRERDMEVGLFGQSPFEADCAATPLADGSVLLTLHSRTPALAAERTSVEQAGLRTIVGLGQMLAHEIKNPLAGIRGAAQLLKTGAQAEDAPLAQLIVDETDRIRRLVDRMEAFSDAAQLDGKPVNIHRVLDRVKALVANGVADGLQLTDDYDPSLPPVLGDEDQLIQVFLNLVKNAAEAAHGRGDGRGAITIHTGYRHGMKVRSADGQTLRGAPIEVRVQDNGPGVPAHLRESLFQPFVSNKAQGAGLGLALVAKLVGGHGGIMDFESEPGRTVFRVLLPIAAEEAPSA